MIKFVDMFSGIGGFREGLTRAGGFECVGHCEIDKYANRSYNALFDTKGEWFIEDGKVIAIKPTFPKWSQQPASSMTAVRMTDSRIFVTG